MRFFAGFDEIVDQYAPMNPETDDIITRGTGLKNGMVVLLEDSLSRMPKGYLERGNELKNRALRLNRWAEVSNVSIHTDKLASSGLIVNFIATYGDGDRCKRSHCDSEGWLVKKESLAEGERETLPESDPKPQTNYTGPKAKGRSFADYQRGE